MRIINLIAAGMTSLALTVVPLASATDAGTVYPDHIMRLAEKAAQGPISEEDAEQLREFPELAAALPDYRNSTSETRVVRSKDRSPYACQTVTNTFHAITLFHQSFYDMETSVHFCWQGDNVVRVDPPQTHFSNVSSYANVVGEMHSIHHANGHEGYAKHVWHVENVIPHVGSWNHKYPYNEFNLYPGGGYHAHGSE